MRHVFFCLALSFVAIAQTTSSNVVAHWFPVHAGDKWIYSHEDKDDIGDAAYRNGRMVSRSLQISRWEIEETTLPMPGSLPAWRRGMNLLPTEVLRFISSPSGRISVPV
jgi:hypothetical protein